MAEAGQRSRLFGTDGVRGVAGDELTASLALNLSVAAAAVLGGSAQAGHGARPVAVVGRDPRASGEFLEAAVVAGLASAGVDVLRLGVIPTPGVAYLTGALNASFGVVISASHNPAADNGIKFFGPGGVKLPDATEDAIEARLGEAAATREFGRVSDARAVHELYLDHLLATLPEPPQPPLAGLRIVADCAHGAAYLIAPQALRRAGAEVITIGDEPDGLNINEGCGSTALGALSAAVVEHGADAGIAYDGDADRCLAVDADGQPLDGDQIMTVLATGLKEAGRLAGDAVVVTVMSNQGFHVAMRDAGIAVIETPVGDKHVSAAMRDGGYVLGGEQSGHIIMGRARHHRRRRADQPAAAGRGEPARRAAGRGGQDDAEVPAGPRQRAGRRVAARAADRRGGPPGRGRAGRRRAGPGPAERHRAQDQADDPGQGRGPGRTRRGAARRGGPAGAGRAVGPGSR